ncbi:hypothetical protein B0H14DRAFT_2737770, partial [Mycena olivaceomarginata]
MEYDRGNYSRALQMAQEVYRIARTSGNTRDELNGIRVQAACYSWMGDFNHCMKVLDEGKELVVQAGLQGGQMQTMLMSIEAFVYELKTDYSHARHIQEAILHQTSAVLCPVDHAYALANISFLQIVTGDSADVVSRNLDAAIMAFRTGNNPHGIVNCELYRADLRLREGDTTGAKVEYLRLFASLRDNQIACLCLAKLADPTNTVHTDTVECGRWAVVFLAYALRPLVRSRL